LTLIHSQVGAPWTIERLAHEVSMSRSAFNERFTALVGLPPIRYLTQWRLQLAQEKLRRGGQSIAQIAHAIGYESEAAFNRAFKRSFGEPPARWRDQHSSSES
jgi:AraC-like DNA-binding protein